MTLTTTAGARSLLCSLQDQGSPTRSIETLRIEIDIPTSIREGIQVLYEDNIHASGQGPAASAQDAFEHYAIELVWHQEELTSLIGELITFEHVKIRHLELILPDFHLPIHVFQGVQNVSHLESLSIQYRLTDTRPGSVLSATYITPHVSSFTSSLLTTLDILPNLKRIRLSLPHAYQPPYSPFLDTFIDSALADPKILPVIETVDLTHSAPRYDTILRVLSAHPSTLKHLILDQGIEFSIPAGRPMENGASSDSDDDSVELEPGSDDPLYFTWAGVGYAISALRKEHGPGDYALKSLSIAKSEVNMVETALFPTPVGTKEVLEMLQSGRSDEDADIELGGLAQRGLGKRMIVSSMSRDVGIGQDGPTSSSRKMICGKGRHGLSGCLRRNREYYNIINYVNIAVLPNFDTPARNRPHPPQPQAVSLKVTTPFHSPVTHPRRCSGDTCTI